MEKMILQKIIACSLVVIILFAITLLEYVKKRRQRKIQENDQGLQEIFGKNEGEDL